MVIDHETTPQPSNPSINDFNRGYKRITIEVPISYWTFARQNFITFKEALNFGISFLIADKEGGLEYDYPNCKLLNKLQKTTQRLTELSEENEKLKSGETKEKQEQESQEQIDNEVKEAFGEKETKE